MCFLHRWESNATYLENKSIIEILVHGYLGETTYMVLNHNIISATSLVSSSFLLHDFLHLSHLETGDGGEDGNPFPLL